MVSQFKTICTTSWFGKVFAWRVGGLLYPASWLAGCLPAGWLAAGWMLACWLAAGWLAAGCWLLAAGWLAGFYSFVESFSKISKMEIRLRKVSGHFKSPNNIPGGKCFGRGQHPAKQPR